MGSTKRGSQKELDPGGVVATTAGERSRERGHTREGHEKGDERERKRETEGSPRALRDGGSFIPGSRLPTSISFSSSSSSSSSSRISPSRGPCHLPPASTGYPLPPPSIPLLFHSPPPPSSFYVPTLNPQCRTNPLPPATTAAATTTIDPYSLLLRGTFARSLPGPPRKSFEGNWRVLVSFARESSRTRVSR